MILQAKKRAEGTSNIDVPPALFQWLKSIRSFNGKSKYDVIFFK
jgi:hypothetical protein